MARNWRESRDHTANHEVPNRTFKAELTVRDPK